MTIALWSAAAGAAQPTAAVDVIVSDASTRVPIPYVRVMLTGCDFRVGYTDLKGEVLFDDITEGTCHVIAEGMRYKRPATFTFNALTGQTETVSFAMSSDGAKVIATVHARRSPISERRVGPSSAQRVLDDSLAGALGMAPDVFGNPGAFSIDGKDSSQTAYAVDGTPVAGLGGTGLQGVDSDLFAGASVSTAPSNGSLGGAIGYETALPTFAWITTGSGSFGAFGSHAERLLATGSIGDVGIVVAYATRDAFGFTNDKFYRDLSGLGYNHQGLTNTRGSLAKFRIPAGALGSLTFTGLASNTYADVVCPYRLGSLPCGYGPGLSSTASDRRLTISYQGIIGRTNLSLAYFEGSTRQSQGSETRLIALTPYPFSSTQAVRMHGAIGSVTASIGSRNVISGTFTAYNFSEAFNERMPSVLQWQSSSSYVEANVADSFTASHSLTLQAGSGVSKTAGSPAGLRASVGFTYQAGSRDTIVGVERIGDQQASLQSPTLPSDPPSLIYDCLNHEILGELQGDSLSRQHSSSSSLTWEHRIEGTRLFGNATIDSQDGVPANTLVNAASLPPSALPSGYSNQVQAFADRSSGCPIGTFSLPTSLFFQTSVNDVRRRYTTLRLGYAGQIGKNLQLGMFGTFVNARAYSNSPLLSNPYSIYVPGQQIPNVPFAKGLFLLDYRNGQSPLEGIIGLQYLSSNNSYNLPASLQTSAGLAWASPVGKIVLSVRNLTNTFVGDFYGNNYAVPLNTIGMQPFGTIAQPFHGRSFSIQFLPRIGPANTERAQSVPIDQSTMAASGFVQAETEPLPIAPPKIPIELRNASGTCEAQTYRRLKPDIDALVEFIHLPPIATAAYSRDFGSIRATYIPWGDSYTLQLKPSDFRTSIAFFNCVRFHQGTIDEYRALHLFIPPDASPGDVNFLYSPRVGLYLYQADSSAIPTITFSVLPKTRPRDPFLMRADCPAASRPIVQSILNQLRPILEAGRPGTAQFDGGSAITAPLRVGNGVWTDISIADVFAVSAMESCLSFSAPDGASLKAAYLEGGSLPDVNFSRDFGFYVVSH